MASRRSYSSDSGEDDQVGALAGCLSKLQMKSSSSKDSESQEAPVPSVPAFEDPERSTRLHADAKAAYEEDGLFFDPSNYPEEERLELLQKFFETSAPSKTKRSDGIGWITVRSPSFVDEGLGDDTEGLQAAWEELTNSSDTIDFQTVKKLALKYRCLSGIWLLFFTTGTRIDEAWEKIAKVTVKDKLGTHAKVTPLEDVGEGKALHGQEHAVSVYTRDFTDKADVMKMEGKLRDLGMRGLMTYKPRFYSIIGVYAQNKWRLRPSIYSSRWDEVNNEASVRDKTISYQTKKAYRY
ncbi:UPF0696 protein C11orf68 homolog [Asterias rubens]|uniref:UPF0696 protein C11orf68 homolog n=1 Tax=Asterias rubens TaxID=7604 RepID=UPI001454EBE0|nr:UPF0696 protein C11orf68 homolog [Asterias rubens]XP_033630118.1 UPF0696 protein C11orf68 homolog [Asterias rubens]